MQNFTFLNFRRAVKKTLRKFEFFMKNKNFKKNNSFSARPYFPFSLTTNDRLISADAKKVAVKRRKLHNTLFLKQIFRCRHKLSANFYLARNSLQHFHLVIIR